uniref:Uncharacterized protein n=1 Tax=Parascaris univalens TaxID=6257 RepID=A0A915A331_PARUN
FDLKMARQRLKQEMVNILSKLRREAADVKKEEAATKSRIDSLRKYLLEVQKKLLEKQARIREMDMHRDAFRYLQESQNKLLESMEKMRNSLKRKCEKKFKTCEEIGAQMRGLMETSFAPQICVEFIGTLRISRRENDGGEGIDLIDEAKNVREKLELCLNEIKELKAVAGVLDGELKKMYVVCISVNDVRGMLGTIHSEMLRLNAKLIQYRIKRHRLEANGFVGNVD